MQLCALQLGCDCLCVGPLGWDTAVLSGVLPNQGGHSPVQATQEPGEPWNSCKSISISINYCCTWCFQCFNVIRTSRQWKWLHCMLWSCSGIQLTCPEPPELGKQARPSPYPGCLNNGPPPSAPDGQSLACYKDFPVNVLHTCIDISGHIYITCHALTRVQWMDQALWNPLDKVIHNIKLNDVLCSVYVAACYIMATVIMQCLYYANSMHRTMHRDPQAIATCTMQVGR